MHRGRHLMNGLTLLDGLITNVYNFIIIIKNLINLYLENILLIVVIIKIKINGY